MDGTTVSRFVHQLDTYFDLVDLKDDAKREQIAITLLEGPAYTWYSIQGNETSWVRLKSALLGYGKPVDYAYNVRAGSNSHCNWGKCVFVSCLNPVTKPTGKRTP